MLLVLTQLLVLKRKKTEHDEIQMSICSKSRRNSLDNYSIDRHYLNNSIDHLHPEILMELDNEERVGANEDDPYVENQEIHAIEEDNDQPRRNEKVQVREEGKEQVENRIGEDDNESVIEYITCGREEDYFDTEEEALDYYNIVGEINGVKFKIGQRTYEYPENIKEKLEGLTSEEKGKKKLELRKLKYLRIVCAEHRKVGSKSNGIRSKESKLLGCSAAINLRCIEKRRK